MLEHLLPACWGSLWTSYQRLACPCRGRAPQGCAMTPAQARPRQRSSDDVCTTACCSCTIQSLCIIMYVDEKDSCPRHAGHQRPCTWHWQAACALHQASWCIATVSAAAVGSRLVSGAAELDQLLTHPRAVCWRSTLSLIGGIASHPHSCRQRGLDQESVVAVAQRRPKPLGVRRKVLHGNKL